MNGPKRQLLEKSLKAILKDRQEFMEKSPIEPHGIPINTSENPETLNHWSYPETPLKTRGGPLGHPERPRKKTLHSPQRPLNSRETSLSTSENLLKVHQSPCNVQRPWDSLESVLDAIKHPSGVSATFKDTSWSTMELPETFWNAPENSCSSMEPLKPHYMS